jgi:deazaflavin-dependent oxidoreductase (nitroreductase family)
VLSRAWFWVVGRFGVSGFTHALHRRLYRATGGAGPLGRSLGNLTILLRTTGARTGKRRETALWAYPDGPNLLLVASNGGRPRIPGWCRNLRANPEASVQVGREPRAVRAREAEGAEYDRLFALVSAAYPGYLAYREWWAEQRIPLVVLEPREGQVASEA